MLYLAFYNAPSFDTVEITPISQKQFFGVKDVRQLDS